MFFFSIINFFFFDLHTELPTSIFGTKLRDQVEDRLKFYETGEAVKKNIDVMKEAIGEVLREKEEAAVEKKKKKKKKKDKKKEKSVTNEDSAEGRVDVNGNEAETPKKKKKKDKKATVEDESIHEESLLNGHDEETEGMSRTRWGCFQCRVY